MVDTLHGWECRNLDLMSSRRWARTGLSLEWFRANQIRKARKRFADGGGENIEYLVLQRIWSYKENIFDQKRNKISNKMMRYILIHANLEWREQRSICARILQSKIKTRIKEEELELFIQIGIICCSNGPTHKDGGGHPKIWKAL